MSPIRNCFAELSNQRASAAKSGQGGKVEGALDSRKRKATEAAGCSGSSAPPPKRHKPEGTATSASQETPPITTLPPELHEIITSYLTTGALKGMQAALASNSKTHGASKVYANKVETLMMSTDLSVESSNRSLADFAANVARVLARSTDDDDQRKQMRHRVLAAALIKMIPFVGEPTHPDWPAAEMSELVKVTNILPRELRGDPLIAIANRFPSLPAEVHRELFEPIMNSIAGLAMPGKVDASATHRMANAYKPMFAKADASDASRLAMLRAYDALQASMEMEELGGAAAARLAEKLPPLLVHLRHPKLNAALAHFRRSWTTIPDHANALPTTPQQLVQLCRVGGAHRILGQGAAHLMDFMAREFPEVALLQAQTGPHWETRLNRISMMVQQGTMLNAVMYYQMIALDRQVPPNPAVAYLSVDAGILGAADLLSRDAIVKPRMDALLDAAERAPLAQRSRRLSSMPLVLSGSVWADPDWPTEAMERMLKLAEPMPEEERTRHNNDLCFHVYAIEPPDSRETVKQKLSALSNPGINQTWNVLREDTTDALYESVETQDAVERLRNPDPAVVDGERRALIDDHIKDFTDGTHTVATLLLSLGAIMGSIAYIPSSSENLLTLKRVCEAVLELDAPPSLLVKGTIDLALQHLHLLEPADQLRAWDFAMWIGERNPDTRTAARVYMASQVRHVPQNNRLESLLKLPTPRVGWPIINSESRFQILHAMALERDKLGDHDKGELTDYLLEQHASIREPDRQKKLMQAING